MALCWFAVQDNGRGLPAENRERLFEPYVTTRSKGTGLGLAIVKKIIEEHGGSITLTDAAAVDPAAGSGSLARIRLPHLVIGNADAAEPAARSEADRKLGSSSHGA